MATLVTDPRLEAWVRAQRSADASEHDEVWEGVLMMTPMANMEHQDIATGLSAVLRVVVDWTGSGKVYQGANVSDREQGWDQNYRVPDVVVVLPGSRARDCDTHLCGGPDFLAEIVSPHDHSREKLRFYGKIGVRELLLVDRDPWALELYQPRGSELQLTGRSLPDDPQSLPSAVLPLSFLLQSGTPRPRIEVVHADGEQRWTV